MDRAQESRPAKGANEFGRDSQRRLISRLVLTVVLGLSICQFHLTLLGKPAFRLIRAFWREILSQSDLRPVAQITLDSLVDLC